MQKTQQFDYSKDEGEKEFVCASTSPSGQAIVLGSFDRYPPSLPTLSLAHPLSPSLSLPLSLSLSLPRLRLLSWQPQKEAWEEAAVKEIPHFYTVTAVSWKRDGSRLLAVRDDTL